MPPFFSFVPATSAGLSEMRSTMNSRKSAFVHTLPNGFRQYTGEVTSHERVPNGSTKCNDDAARLQIAKCPRPPAICGGRSTRSSVHTGAISQEYAYLKL